MSRHNPGVGGGWDYSRQLEKELVALNKRLSTLESELSLLREVERAAREYTQPLSMSMFATQKDLHEESDRRYDALTTALAAVDRWRKG